MREGGAKKLIRAIGKASPAIDVILAPLTFIAALWFRIARYWGVKNLRVTNAIFLKTGMFPIVDHYYEPLFDYRKISNEKKPFTHLDLRPEAQLEFLKQFKFGDELTQLPQHGTDLKYHYQNGSFPSGDAELYYSIIRKFKPKKILEVGSGYSTLMALEAIAMNKKEDGATACDLTCIEPYEMPQLEKLNIGLIRKKVEDVDREIFDSLNSGDILFVDSSHIIRPAGDVNHLILKILPDLKPGVWVHFHDIFLPYHYPLAWMKDEYRMWNEQYLLEAFLLGNQNFEIVCALNYLKNNYWNEVAAVFPMLGRDRTREPGSFWIVKKSSSL